MPRTSLVRSLIDCLGIDEESAASVEIYPNPSNGLITINTGEMTSGTIEISDLLGKKIARIPFNSNSFKVDLNEYQSRGTYLVELYDNNGDIKIFKKVVKK